MEDGACSLGTAGAADGGAVLALALAAGLGGGGALLVATAGKVDATIGAIVTVATGAIVAFIGSKGGGGCRVGVTDDEGDEPMLLGCVDVGDGVVMGCKGGIGRGSKAGTSLCKASLAAGFSS